MRISDWSSDVCSSDLFENDLPGGSSENAAALTQTGGFTLSAPDGVATVTVGGQPIFGADGFISGVTLANAYGTLSITGFTPTLGADGDVIGGTVSYSYVLTDNTLLHSGVNDGSLTDSFAVVVTDRSEEHTSELPSLMRTSYAVFCLKKKN